MGKKDTFTLLRTWDFGREQKPDIDMINKAFSDLFEGIETFSRLEEPSEDTKRELGIAGLPAFCICSENLQYMKVFIGVYPENGNYFALMGVTGKGQQIKAAEMEPFYAKCMGSVSNFTNAIRASRSYAQRFGGSAALAAGITAGVSHALVGGVKLAAKGVKALLRDKEAYEKEMAFYQFAMNAGDFVLGGIDNGGFIGKLKEKASGGNLIAQYQLGSAYDEGRGVEANHEEAISWFAQAAEGGEERSKIVLISEYLFGDTEYDTEYVNTGVTYLKELADTGETWAVEEYLSIYDKGTVRGIDKDFRKAQELALPYAESGNVYAAMLVATAYDAFLCDGAFEKDDSKAAFIYEKIVESKDERFAPEAAFYLGKMYQNGRGKPQDMAKAASYFAVANRGNVFQAKTELAHIYTFGDGIMPNFASAKQLCDELIRSRDFDDVAFGNYCRFYIADQEEKYGESLQYAKAYLDSNAVELEHADEIKAYIEEKENLLASMTEQEKKEYLKIKPEKSFVSTGKNTKIIAVILACIVAAVAGYFLFFSESDRPAVATGTVEKSDDSTAIAMEATEDEEEALPELFHDGVAVMNGTDGCDLIDEEGNLVVTLDYSYVSNVSDNGRAVASIQESDEDWYEKWGIINNQGETICEFKYDDIWLGDLDEDALLPASVDDTWGYINWDGEEVIPLQFDEVWPFADNGFACIQLNGQYGAINKSGAIVIEPVYSTYFTFAKNGLACVEQDGKYGYINAKGEYVISPEFDQATKFDDFDRAIVTIGDKQGIIDSSGNYILECEYDLIGNYTGQGAMTCFDDYGYCKVYDHENGGMALINTEGEFICPFDYVSIGAFSKKGLAPVEIANGENSTYEAFINMNGEIVLSTDYENAGTFSEGGLAAVAKDFLWGYINLDGEEIIPLQYEYAGNFNRWGLSSVHDGKNIYVINEKGERICSVPFTKDYCPWEIVLQEYKDGYSEVWLVAMDPDVQTRQFIFKNETLIYDSENR